jgi:predicted DNA-binding transcriptional regulator YafY
MRPTDRLFQIIQILRGSTDPVTAAALAEELKVSKRTIYRDIAGLIGQRIFGKNLPSYEARSGNNFAKNFNERF